MPAIRLLLSLQRRRARVVAAMLACLWIACFSHAPLAQEAGAGASLVIGSKRFTESYILGEIMARSAAAQGPARHRPGLGNTAVVFEALKAGAIDAYPEYLGTIDAEILKNPAPTGIEAMRRALAPQGFGIAAPFGFQNGYALAMRETEAARLGIATVSDLARHPGLALGLSHEFIGRADGWPGLAARYALPHKPAGIDHGIAYEALASGRIAVTDIYSTDAKIESLGLRVLKDDQAYFPRYDAVVLYRLDTAQRHPAAWRAIVALEGRIDAARMVALNAQAELKGMPFDAVARQFLAGPASGAPAPARGGFLARLLADDLGRLTREHLFLVLVAVAVATLVGVPLGAAAAARPRLEQWVMGVAGLMQTIPSLALLAMLIPLVGDIGTVPALIALTMYALLPIVRNAATGLAQVPAGLRQAGTALGMSPWLRWRMVDLPLALPVILAGVKTAAITTVGTATIAAFIGAGGFGERIAAGLALNDHAALMAGAVPAAVLALLVQGAFELAERAMLRRPRGAGAP